MEQQTLNHEFNFYYNLLSEGQKESLLSVMKSFLEKKSEKFERISLSQYNKELDDAENRIAAGHFISHESLKEDIKKW